MYGIYTYTNTGDSVVKNLPAVQETWAPPLGWKDPLEKEMATHSSVLAWRIPWMGEPGELRGPWSPRGHSQTRLSDCTATYTIYLSPGDLPNPGTEVRSPALQADSLPSEPPGKPIHTYTYIYV